MATIKALVVGLLAAGKKGSASNSRRGRRWPTTQAELHIRMSSALLLPAGHGKTYVQNCILHREVMRNRRRKKKVMRNRQLVLLRVKREEKDFERFTNSCVFLGRTAHMAMADCCPTWAFVAGLHAGSARPRWCGAGFRAGKGRALNHAARRRRWWHALSTDCRSRISTLTHRGSAATFVGQSTAAAALWQKLGPGCLDLP
jgi:hypothetical protein